MPASQIVLDLVARFQEHIDAYKSGNYNETQLRRDFLDPFFKDLGWDMDNTSGYAETYRDIAVGWPWRSPQLNLDPVDFHSRLHAPRFEPAKLCCE